MKSYVASAAVSLFLFSSLPFSRGADEIVIDRSMELFPQPIPVSVSGFSGEVDAVFKNDIIFLGMKNVAPSEAKYLISGSNSGKVEGRLIRKVDNAQLLARAFTGSSQRLSTHALADAIAKELGLIPIAQTKVTFKVETGPSVGEIYVSDYDGHNAQEVTHDARLVSAPCWAGHTSLYYSSYKLGKPSVFSQELSSGTRKAIVRGPGSTMSPAVSPDGHSVAFIWDKGGSPNLYVSNADGSNVRQLSHNRDAESSPCWSPDGRTICFVSRERGPASLFTVSASGGTRRHLETTGAGNTTEPSWSPDGKWIAFTSQRAGGFDICVVRSQGGPAMVITEGEDPSWAPNSRALIFCKGPDHRKVLSLLDVATKHVKDIARILESDSQPSWAP